MRDRYPTLSVRLKRASSLAGAWLLVLAGVLGLEAQGAPSITSISPASGGVYDQVTITGTGFGSSRGASRVTFGGTEASRYYQWSDTEIEVLPPSSLADGANAVVVTVGGQASNGVDYTRLPQLTAVCGPRGSTLSEPSGTFEMGVHRGGPTTDAVAVTLTYRGTATLGADYTGPAAVTIAAGERNATATLTVVDDAGREGNEQIIFQASAEGYLRGTCTLTVTDDDPEGTPSPVISLLRPIWGGVGASVAIAGSNFGATKGTSTVSFNGTPAATTSWSATSITATVPAGAATGNVWVTVGGQVSNGLPFTVTPTPAVSGLDPASGEVGTPVVITGSNFRATKGTSQVAFNGTTAATTSWSDTSITATVPEGAGTGPVVVTVGGVASNGATFTVVEPDRPVRLSCPSRVSEPTGAASIIALLNSGDAPVADLTFAITHSGTATHETDYTVGTLTIEAGRTFGTMDPQLRVVDDSLSEGEETIELTLTASGYEEARCTITLEDDETPTPAISGLNPTSGAVGTPVVITGSNFRASRRGPRTVAFNGTTAATTSWSDTSITATVPEGAATGEVVVTVGGTASNGVSFTVTAPPGVTVSPDELTIPEGETREYTVVLDTQPSSSVTVTVWEPIDDRFTADPTRLVFGRTTWDTPKPVTVTAPEDDNTRARNPHPRPLGGEHGFELQRGDGRRCRLDGRGQRRRSPRRQ